MIKGLYSAVSAMIMNSNRQSILAHNISNMNTPGFKQVMATIEEYLSTDAIDPMASLGMGNAYSSLGSLGLGVQSGENEIDFSQGNLESTGNTFDFAIEGSAFFRVKTPDGDRYTRDGRFLLDAKGTLVTSEGYQVLGKNGQKITLESSDAEVGENGEIYIDGESVGQIGLFEFTDPDTDLQHDTGNMYEAIGTAKTAADSTVVQGTLESSNVNASQIMSQLIEVARAYEAAQEMVQNQDELLGKTISSLGTF